MVNIALNLCVQQQQQRKWKKKQQIDDTPKYLNLQHAYPFIEQN